MEMKAAPVLWKFAVHIFVGTAIFVLIYLPAVGLNLLVHQLTELKIGSLLIWTLYFAEGCLVIGDTVLYVVFLVKTTWLAAKEL